MSSDSDTEFTERSNSRNSRPRNTEEIQPPQTCRTLPDDDSAKAEQFLHLANFFPRCCSIQPFFSCIPGDWVGKGFQFWSDSPSYQSPQKPSGQDHSFLFHTDAPASYGSRLQTCGNPLQEFPTKSQLGPPCVRSLQRNSRAPGLFSTSWICVLKTKEKKTTFSQLKTTTRGLNLIIVLMHTIYVKITKFKST